MVIATNYLNTYTIGTPVNNICSKSLGFNVKWCHAKFSLKILNLKELHAVNCNTINNPNPANYCLHNLITELILKYCNYVKWRHAKLEFNLSQDLMFYIKLHQYKNVKSTSSSMFILIQMEQEELLQSLHLDITTRPPSPPIGYGTRLYPQEPGLNQLTDAKQITDLLSAASRARKNAELSQLYSAKSSLSYDIVRQYGSEKRHRPFCEMCSEVDLADESNRRWHIKYHTHHSSLQYRTSMELDEKGEYFCTTCAITPHGYKTGDRSPVLLSSSTLACWRGRQDRHLYPGDKLHVDELSIPGAKIADLRQALYAEYSQSTSPLDILLCCGLNNIMRGDTATEIIHEMRVFKEEVQGWNQDNTFAIMTLPYPPSISFLNRDYFRHKESVIDKDRTSTINKLNPQIIELNESGQHADHTRRAPRMTTWGLRKALIPCNSEEGHTRRTVGNLTAHRHSVWREDVTSDQLHLRDDVRLKSGKSTVSYFARIYGFRMPPDRNVNDEAAEVTGDEPKKTIDPPATHPDIEYSDVSVDDDDDDLARPEAEHVHLVSELVLDIFEEAVETSEWNWINSHLDVQQDPDSSSDNVLIITLLDEEEKEAENWWEG